LGATTPGAAPSVLTGHDGAVNAIAFSPDGRTLATGGDDGTGWLWDLGNLTGEPRRLPGEAQTVNALAFSLDGQTLATGGSDGAVQLWHLLDLDADPESLPGQLVPVTTVAFSPDGQTLAAGGGDGTVRVWSMNAARLSEEVCRVVTGNLTLGEWRQFMGAESPYRPTCPGLPERTGK
jgi:WD40 repeat protein